MGPKAGEGELDCAGSCDRARGEPALDSCALVVPGLGQVDRAASIVRTDQAFWRAVESGDILALEESQAGL